MLLSVLPVSSPTYASIYLSVYPSIYLTDTGAIKDHYKIILAYGIWYITKIIILLFGYFFLWVFNTQICTDAWARSHTYSTYVDQAYVSGCASALTHTVIISMIVIVLFGSYFSCVILSCARKADEKNRTRTHTQERSYAVLSEGTGTVARRAD